MISNQSRREPKKMLCFAYLFLLCVESLAIPPDYYSGELEEYSEDRDNITGDIKKYYSEELFNSSSNVTIISSDFDSDSDDENDGFFAVYVATKKTGKKHYTKDVTDKYSTQPSIIVKNRSDKIGNSKILRQQSRPTGTTINVFRNYDYIYDEASTPVPKQLREDLGHYEENIITAKPDDNQDVTSTSVAYENSSKFDNKSLKYLPEFFNLEPAAGVLKYEKLSERSVNKNKVWYVPEKYPCWQMPVIYGELGRKKKVSEIFLVYYGKLKNVIDENPAQFPVPKNLFYVDPAKLVNKWCAVPPCYGDHTLCLFSLKTYSQLCDKQYVVHTPSMSEQMAIVNTVNSMRNSVARGTAEEYMHLPPAANMKQVLYDFDLQEMAEAWLRQCLPGLAPCSSLDNEYIMQLECTKYAEFCCINSYKGDLTINCIPEYECFILPFIGCVHAWFLSAGKTLSGTDVECGHTAPDTFNTVQLLWAETYKVGCAFGEKPNGDVRVVCNFTPGAPYNIESNYYCGLIAHQDITENYSISDYDDITDLKFLASQGILLNEVNDAEETIFDNKSYEQSDKYMTISDNLLRTSDLNSLNHIYKSGWIRQKLHDYSNGTKGMIARMVTKYTFHEHDESRCDTDQPIYVIGRPGALCVERSRRFDALCYDFGDPTPGYRLVAILAPIALFSLILYDLFSGVVRQTNY